MSNLIKASELLKMEHGRLSKKLHPMEDIIFNEESLKDIQIHTLLAQMMHSLELMIKELVNE